MVVIIAIIDPSSEEPHPVNAKEGVVGVAEMDIKDYAAYLVKEVAGKNTNNGKETFVASSGTADYLAIDINASDNLTPGLQKTSMLVDSIDVFKKAFAERPDINSLKLVWYLDLVDQKGNESTGVVMRVRVTRGNATTINWDNVLMDNLPKIADEYWEHPLYSK